MIVSHSNKSTSLFLCERGGGLIDEKNVACRVTSERKRRCVLRSVKKRR